MRGRCGSGDFSITTLCIYFEAFRAAERMACLSLKSAKCILVPLSQTFNLQLSENIRSWLVRNLHQWARFSIKPAGKYLGFWIGPGAGPKQWEAPGAKWKSRSRSIGMSGAPPAPASYLYSTYSVPVLEYVGQLVQFPKHLWKIEGNMVCAALHVAPSSIPACVGAQLGDLGLRPFRSASAACASALWRTSRVTLPEWPTLWDLMMNNARDHLPYVRWVQDIPWPAWWDSPAFVWQLRQVHIDGGVVSQSKQVQKAFLSAKVFENECRIETFQRCAYKVIVREWRAYQFVSFFADRLSKWIPEELLHNISCAGLVSGIRSANGYTGMCALKTVVHSWCTDTRLHNGSRKCKFCNESGGDAMSHLFRCDVFFRIPGETFKLDADQTCPLEIWGLQPSQPSRLCVAFQTYHKSRAFGGKERFQLSARRQFASEIASAAFRDCKRRAQHSVQKGD